MPDRKSDEHALPERRHRPTLAVRLGQREYDLGGIGKGLIVFATVVGIVFACSSSVIDIFGKKIIDRNQTDIGEVGVIARTGLEQSRLNQQKLDSMAQSVSQRVSKLEDAVSMLAELKCKELRDERAPYLPPTCTKILRQQEPTP